MRKKIRVHYLENSQNQKIVYFPDYKRIFKANEAGIRFIQDIADGKKKETIKDEFNLSDEDYDCFASRLNIQNETRSIKHTTINSDRILSRLVIHITNMCNLNCKYCYANGGNYLSEEQVMSFEMLEKILITFYEHYKKINAIQFFGGEPLMNIPAIEKTCEWVRKIDAERGTTTQFGIVTNGMLIDEEFIRLVKKYNISVTVSYDGDIIVNDIIRVNKNGEGVSKQVIKNTKMLKAQTNEPNTIEVTYTQVHVDKGIGILDVVKHIQELFPDTYVHLVPAGGTESDDYTVRNLGIFADSIDEIFREIDEHEASIIPSYSLADRIFRGLRNPYYNGSDYICDAGLGTLSVSVNGDVYPCFMFTDQNDLKLGNINDADLFERDEFKNQLKYIQAFSHKESNKECRNCHINTLCNGCLGLNSYHSGDPLILSPKICQMFRDMVDRAIINFSERMDGK